MALPTSAEKTWLPILEIIDSKGKGYSTNFTGIYSNFIQKLNLSKLEIEAEIEENTFAIKEILKIGRDTLLEIGLLHGSTTSFEISKKGKALLKLCISKKTSDLSELSFDILLAYMEYDFGKRKPTITINEIEYTTKGWDKKVFKFANWFNIKAEEPKIIRQQPTLFDNNTIAKSNNIKINKSVKDIVKGLIETHEIQLKKELLEKFKKKDPFHFEELATNIVFEVVYDGIKITEELRKDVARITKKTGDGGIDGIVNRKDRFGGSKIHYIQAKRYADNSVGIEAINSFFTALTVNGAKDGLIITTSKFSQQAINRIDELHRITNIKIIPIDGEKLVEMMIDHKIGINISQTIEVKEINESFFVVKK